MFALWWLMVVLALGAVHIPTTTPVGHPCYLGKWPKMQVLRIRFLGCLWNRYNHRNLLASPNGRIVEVKVGPCKRTQFQFLLRHASDIAAADRAIHRK